MEARAYREELLKLMLSHASDSYKDTIRVAALIEDKAQKVAALAGVFLAAGFAYIKNENLTAGAAVGGFFTLALLALAITTLIATVVVCLRVLWVRQQAMPIQLSLVNKIILDIMRQPDAVLTEELQDASRFEFTRLWQVILDRQGRINEAKARLLRYAQGLLTASILVISASLVFVLLGHLGAVILGAIVDVFKG